MMLQYRQVAKKHSYYKLYLAINSIIQISDRKILHVVAVIINQSTSNGYFDGLIFAIRLKVMLIKVAIT